MVNRNSNRGGRLAVALIAGAFGSGCGSDQAYQDVMAKADRLTNKGQITHTYIAKPGDTHKQVYETLFGCIGGHDRVGRIRSIDAVKQFNPAYNSIPAPMEPFCGPCEANTLGSPNDPSVDGALQNYGIILQDPSEK